MDEELRELRRLAENHDRAAKNKLFQIVRRLPPQFGQLESRVYRCILCGHEQRETTNHTGAIYGIHCSCCSWKGMRDEEGGYHQPTGRTFTYAGYDITENWYCDCPCCQSAREPMGRASEANRNPIKIKGRYQRARVSQRARLRQLLKSGILEYYGIPYQFKRDGFGVCRFEKPRPFHLIELIRQFRRKLARTREAVNRGSIKRHLRRLESELDANAAADDVSTLFITQDCDARRINHEIAHYVIATESQRQDPLFKIDPSSKKGQAYSNLMESRTLILNAVFDEYFDFNPQYYLIYEDLVNYAEEKNDPILSRRPDLVLYERAEIGATEDDYTSIPYYRNTAAKDKVERAYFWLLSHGFFEGPFAVKHEIVARKLGLFS